MIILGRPIPGHKEIQPGGWGSWSWSSGPDSAGGVGVQLSYRNDSDKTIKYVVFVVIPYNAVDDVVGSMIGDKISCRLQDTGPIAPGATCRNNWWECLWYNYSIKRVKITSVEIEYMDGSTETIPEEKLQYSESGCYVATAVYGSYDCPQVWTLRRFRDDTLAASWYGRAFVRLYYAVSGKPHVGALVR